MFRRLRVKLTVLYAGLFCLALTLIGATAYAVIAGNTHRMAREQLATTSAVFDRLSEIRMGRLQDSARALAFSPNLHEAAVARDDAAIRASLSRIRTNTGADLAFFVTSEGLVVGDHGTAGASVPPGLQRALAGHQTAPGVMRAGEDLYQAAAAEAPGNLGWVVVGVRLDAEEMAALEELSTMPLLASTPSRGRDGWGVANDTDREALNAFIGAAEQSQTPVASFVTAESGRLIVLAKPMPTLDGTRSVLLLRYPLSSALSPYRALFNSLFAIGLFGLTLLIAGTWFLARGITQPLSTLEDAAKKLQQGVYDSVEVRSKDELSNLAESFNAMTGAIRERERRITQLAYHDTETRLPNRLALERRLTAAQHPERLYLAAIGVDRFAHVRGAIGYAMAGALVRTLGARLARLAPNAPMARLSTDVLGVTFLADDDGDARRRADAFVSNLEQSVALDGHAVDVHVSIGIAQPREKDESASAMIERASVALDQARAGRHKVSLFDKVAYGDPAQNLSLMGEMLKAIETGAIHLVHQPKYNFRTGRIESAESLVRWRHPNRGMIAPDLFVPMAEETGHIGALTEWVLRRAISDQKKLAEAGRPLTLSVNISARLLSDTDFAKRAVELVRGAQHPICFEITETAVIDNPTVALENIDLFAANGVRVAIDDYGAGLSSLAYLKQLPAHELKIDKLFVRNLTASERDALLVRSTIDLAHSLGLEVTAEGVETPAAFALLAGMKCDLAQGYLVARPASVEELVTILGDERRMRFYQQTAATGAASAQSLDGAAANAR